MRQLIVLVQLMCAMEHLCVDCVASQQYQQYLESFPIIDSYTFNKHQSDYNNTSAHIIKNKKKNLKPGELRKSVMPLEDIHDQESLLYIGYTMDPFGPSEEIERERLSNMNSISSEYSINERGKRGVKQLYNMVSCATGCNPLSYKGYGCYCGFLGSGRSTDGIDRCCMLHDYCYTTVNCPMFFVYFTPYLWKCWRGTPLCAIENLGYGRNKSCARRLCECDRQLAICLSYNPCPRRRALCTSAPFRLLQNLILY